MRHPLLVVSLSLGVSLLAARTGWAQVNTFGAIGNDPFTTYYAWYLPNQAYQAMQPRVEDTINAITVQRQRAALAEREGMFDQRSRFDLDEDEGMFGRYAPQRGARGGAALSSTTNPFGQNLRGSGPPLYYNRTGRYFPSIRPGRGPNRNIASLRASRSSGFGGGGMGGGMPTMPGPR